MDMLTATVATLVGAEQGRVRSGSSGHIESEGVSFAQSFDEGVALAVGDEAQGADKNAAFSHEVKDGAALNIPDEPNVTPGGISKAIAGAVVAAAPKDGVMSCNGAAVPAGDVRVVATFERALSEVGALANGAATQGGDTAVATSSGLQEKGAAGDSAVPVERSSGRVEELKGNLLSGQVVPGAGAMGVTTSSIPIAQAAPESGRLLVSRGDADSGAVNEVKETAKAKSVDGSKKATKIQESKGRHKSSLKGVDGIANVTDAVAHPADGLGAQSAVSVPVAVTVPVPAQQNGTAVTQSSGFGMAVSLAGGPSASGAVAGGKERARSAKTGVEDGEAAGPSTKPAAKPSTKPVAGDAVVSPKVGEESAKAAVAALPVGRNGDGKTQGSAAAVAVTHTGAEIAVATTHTAAVALAGVVLPAHVAGAASPAKAQSGELNGQSGLGHVVAGGQDVSGGLVATAEGSSHRTLMATPTALEVGVANGTHGWLKIRAELSGGGVVNASLSAASPAGQEMLHRELPSLTAYLQQERVAVNAIVVHPAVAGMESRDFAGGLGSGGSGQAQQGNAQGGDGRQAAAGLVANYADELVYEGANRVGIDGILSPVTHAGGGRWLSVRA